MKKLLFILAFVSALSSSSQNSTQLYLSNDEYKDPKGFFSIFPPKDWKIKEFPNDSRGKVHFSKNDNNNLMILVKAIPQKSLQELYDYCLNEGKDKLVSMGAKDLTINKLKIGGFDLIKRSFAAQGSKCIMVDYYLNGVNHNLFYSAPTNEFGNDIGIIESSILTYNPNLIIVSPEDQKFHNLQSRRRVAKLLFEMGEYDQARMFVEDGFKISPNDTVLLEIEKSINDKEHKNPILLETGIKASDSSSKDLAGTNSKNEENTKESTEGDDNAVVYMILTLAGALIIVFSKKIADGTAWPGFTRLSTPVIGIVMMIGGFNLLFDNGHVFLGIITILLSILIFASPLIYSIMINKK